jgi:aspartate aminotransferase
MPISQKVASYLNRGSWIRKMFEEGGRLKAQHGEEKVFDFSLGNPPEEPPEAFYRELRKMLEKPVPGMHRYMPNAGFPEVRESVAQTVTEESGLPVEGRHIIMTVGAGGALNVVLKALLDPGEEVIVLVPYFVEYDFYVDNHGGITVPVETGPGFAMDMGVIEQAINEQTKAIIINSPNNPTGVVYLEKELRNLGKLLRRKGEILGRDLYLISDEPYRKLIYDGTVCPHIFPLVDNAIIVTSHSKDLALAGERIGHIAVSPRCADLHRLLDALVFANRTLGFVNAPALMQRIVGKLRGVSVEVASYQDRRDILYGALIDLGFEMVKPMGAFYMFPKSPIEDDLAFVQAAQKKHILVAPGFAFGSPGYFRIAYSVPKETLQRSLEAWQALAMEFHLPG